MGSCVLKRKTKINAVTNQSIALNLGKTEEKSMTKLISLLPVNESQFVSPNEEYDQKVLEGDEYVGEGSHGVVKKVINRSKQEMYIEKRMSTTEAQHLFQNEQNILKMLHHPKICRLKRVRHGQINNTLILDFMPGKSLLDLTSSTKLTEEDVKDIVYQVLEIFLYIHQLGVIHRDIKPDNILVEADAAGNYDVCLIDFGVAVKVKEQNKSVLIYGNSRFKAPEESENIVTEKKDIWSLGMVLCYAIFGHVPVDVEVFGPIEFYKKDPKFKEISPELEDILSLMLEENYNNRPDAQELMKHAWFNGISKKLMMRKKLISQTCIKNNFVADKLEKQSMRSAEIDKRNKEFIADLMMNLQNYVPGNKVQQNILALIVHNMGFTEEKRERANAFRLLDTGGKGRLDVEDVRRALTFKFDKVAVEQSLKLIFKRMDRNNSQYIEFDEFIQATIPKDILLGDKYLKDIFYYLSRPSDYIDFDTIRTKFKFEKGVANKIWTKFIAKHDVNNDGKLNLEEFIQFMRYASRS